MNNILLNLEELKKEKEFYSSKRLSLPIITGLLAVLSAVTFPLLPYFVPIFFAGFAVAFAGISVACYVMYEKTKKLIEQVELKQTETKDLKQEEKDVLTETLKPEHKKANKIERAEVEIVSEEEIKKM